MDISLDILLSAITGFFGGLISIPLNAVFSFLLKRDELTFSHKLDVIAKQRELLLQHKLEMERKTKEIELTEIKTRLSHLEKLR